MDTSDDDWPLDLLGRADAAYQAEFARWEGIIDGVRRDRSLTPYQRAAAIFALRMRQRLEAQGLRQRLLDDERPAPRRTRSMPIRQDRRSLT